MADLQFGKPVTYEAPKGMSLADMVNMASGVQQLRQAQQLNPLALQKAQADLESAQAGAKVATETVQPKISEAKSAAEQKRIEALKSQYGLDSDQHKTYSDVLTGFAYDKRLSPESLKKNPHGAIDLVREIKAEARAKGLPDEKLDVLLAPAMSKAVMNPEELGGYMQNMMTSGMTSAEKRALGSGSVSVTPSGLVQRTTPAIYGAQQQVALEKPQGIEQLNTVKINGIDYKLNPATQKLEPLTLPGSEPDQSVGKNKNVGGQNVSTQAPLVQLDNLRSPGQFSEQEKARYEAGAKDWEDATERAKIASESKLASGQIRRSLAQAAGSKPGQVVREAGKALFGNSELDTLLKNLAQQQLRQAKLMGINTVNAEKDLATANGSENITAEALAHIIDQADATNLAAEKYNKAQEAMQAKHGKDKTYLNNDNFKKAWGTNYDPLAFIIQSTNRRNIPQADKEKIIQYYAEHLGSEDQEQLPKKLKNLKRLERGDF